jgi:hypothetical protein
MAFRTNSQARRVTDYLSDGKTLTASEAGARFGVQNFRALISHIKETVEAYGNHEVWSEPTANRTTGRRYGMDTFV